MASAEGAYTTEERVTIAEVPNLRVRRLALGPGQCVPWHLHSHITDTFFCMEGPMRVETRRPTGDHVLEAGQTLAVGPGTAHRVSGLAEGPCRFVVVQGVGPYDYVPFDPASGSASSSDDAPSSDGALSENSGPDHSRPA